MEKELKWDTRKLADYIKEQKGYESDEELITMLLNLLGTRGIEAFASNSKFFAEQKKDGKDMPHPLLLIFESAMALGWGIGVENDQKNVDGLIVGNDEYFKRRKK